MAYEESLRSKSKFIHLLQNAHAGELAAALAYWGHSLSVEQIEAQEIKKIENEEWAHRKELNIILHELGSRPRFLREKLMLIIGVSIFSLCRLGGWLNIFNFGWYFSMYGAGKLERGNIVEYEIAAQYAIEAGYPQYVDCLLGMAELEWDHEKYFRTKCLSSKWSQYLSVWGAPDARNLIRDNFERFKVKRA